MRSPALLPLLVVLWVASASAADPSALEPEEILATLDHQLRGRHGLLRHSTEDRGYTSETLTLSLELAVVMDDRVRFDQELTRLRAHHLTDAGLLRWRLDRVRDGWCSSASVDDLRAVRALLEAHGRWGDDLHLSLAVRMGAAVLMHEVRDGTLVDSASWPCDRRGRPLGPPAEPAEKLTLSFADLEALLLLVPHDPRASGVLYRTRAVLLAGTLHASGPRWAYTVATRRYDDEGDNPIHRELQRLQLLDGQPPDAMGAATRLEICAQQDESWRSGDNVAHLALAARRLDRCGEAEASHLALERLDGFMLEEGLHGGLYGYDHGDHDTVAWAFDNFLALVALVELGQGQR